MRSSPTSTKVREGQGGGVPGIEAETPLQSRESMGADEHALKELQPMDYNPWWGRRAGGAAHVGSSVLLKGGPHGMEPCWSSAGRAAACGKAKQDQFMKDHIPWEGPCAGAGEECKEKGAA